MSILHDLYNGNICPAEKFTKGSGEYQKLMADTVSNIDKLMSMLDKKRARTME